MEHIQNIPDKTEEVAIPACELCGHNCADGCIYWGPMTATATVGSGADGTTPTSTLTSVRGV